MDLSKALNNLIQNTNVADIILTSDSACENLKEYDQNETEETNEPAKDIAKKNRLALLRQIAKKRGMINKNNVTKCGDNMLKGLNNTDKNGMNETKDESENKVLTIAENQTHFVESLPMLQIAKKESLALNSSINESMTQLQSLLNNQVQTLKDSEGNVIRKATFDEVLNSCKLAEAICHLNKEKRENMRFVKDMIKDFSK